MAVATFGRPIGSPRAWPNRTGHPRFAHHRGEQSLGTPVLGVRCARRGRDAGPQPPPTSRATRRAVPPPLRAARVRGAAPVRRMDPGPAPRAAPLARERGRRRAPGAGPVRAGLDRAPEVPGSSGNQSDRHPRHRAAAGADQGARLGRGGRGRRHDPGAALRLGHLRRPPLRPGARGVGAGGRVWSTLSGRGSTTIEVQRLAPPARRHRHDPSQRRSHRPALRVSPGAALGPALGAVARRPVPWTSPASSTCWTRSTTSSTRCAAPPRQPWWSSSRRRSRRARRRCPNAWPMPSTTSACRRPPRRASPARTEFL